MAQKKHLKSIQNWYIMDVNQEPCIDGQERTGTAMFDKVEQMALKIEGMTCGHCQKRVEEALKAVKGVKGVQVSLGGKTAEIRYAAGKTDRQALVKAVTDAGYTVTD